MLVNRYDAYFPPAIHFGSGCRALSQDVLLACTSPEAPRVLVVSSSSVHRLDITQELLADLGDLVVGTHIGIPADPPLETVELLRDSARECNATVYLALGGGSVLDAAKTAAFLHHADATVESCFRGQSPLPVRGLPLVALPTTAGTGAEITKNAVLTDCERDFKGSIRSPGMIPAAAIIDPDFTLGLPPEITVDTGMDALTQAIESYVSAGASAMSQALAGKAVELLLHHLPRAWANGGDQEARNKTAEGSMLSAMAFAQSGLGAVHGLAHPIGHRFAVPHGKTCAILLEHVMAWNLPAVTESFNRLAKAAGLANAEALIKAVREIRQAMQIPADFSSWGIAASDLDYIIANCRSGSMKANPRPMSDDDVAQMLRNLGCG